MENFKELKKVAMFYQGYFKLARLVGLRGFAAIKKANELTKKDTGIDILTLFGMMENQNPAFCGQINSVIFEDHVIEFLDAASRQSPGDVLPAGKFYEAYQGWMQQKNLSGYIVSQKKFGSLAGERYHRRKNGTKEYLDVCLIHAEADAGESVL